MADINDSLDEADARHFTRPLPKSAQAQMRFLVRQLKGTRAVADLLGISQRTVERYLKGQLKHPRPALADRMHREVRHRWQPRIRARARQRAATTDGLFMSTRARFGFTAAPGTTDDPRVRHLNQALPPAYAARLFTAQDAGATETQLRAILAEGLGEMYFRDRGRRAQGLDVEFTDIEQLDLDF
ncbi:telomere-protecting terminal protein Tpg [Streptomyces olivochromogenes]|uniref:telomere-protecting terminal protein Tpg n=1 Tax=Streptomyces olivochromogenes TaxID=1963 RepID=UPI001F28636F|nr:XRE family transcriptional regulator [Streptomyces olivochromogenes]MCF3131240.1 XRE family transcriptional regulator [Streptomyces olivochromogenes]